MGELPVQSLYRRDSRSFRFSGAGTEPAPVTVGIAPDDFDEATGCQDYCVHWALVFVEHDRMNARLHSMPAPSAHGPFISAFAAGTDTRAIFAWPSAMSAGNVHRPPSFASIHVSRSARAARTHPPLPTAICIATCLGAFHRRIRNAAISSLPGAASFTDWNRV